MNDKKYDKELQIMKTSIINAYNECFTEQMSTTDKDIFDIVTDNDMKIERKLLSVINTVFPDDRILREETNFETIIKKRTWTIDPIDGTYNMSRGIPLYGVQCALYDDNEVVLSIVYLPEFKEIYTAQKNQGAYLNGKRIIVRNSDLNHSVVSFGDFPHKRPMDFRDEQIIMNDLSFKIAKIRMFGSACIDFAYIASGKTDGTIIFTKNRWDIDPGILLAREAGARIKSLEGDYNRESRVVIATATEELYNAIVCSSNLIR